MEFKKPGDAPVTASLIRNQTAARLPASVVEILTFASCAGVPLHGTQKWPSDGLGSFCKGSEPLAMGLEAARKASALAATGEHRRKRGPGQEIRKLRDRAQCIFSSHAEKGSPDGRYCFALALLVPYSSSSAMAFRHPPNNDRLALLHLKRAALKGYGPAFLRSLKVPAQRGQGYNQWIKRAATAGNTEAQYELGVAHFDRRPSPGIPTDAKAAEKWLMLAAEQGNSFAALKLGELYASGAPGVAMDYWKAIRWFETLLDKPTARRNGRISAPPHLTLATIYCGVSEMDKALEMTKLGYNAGEDEARERLASNSKRPGWWLKQGK